MNINFILFTIMLGRLLNRGLKRLIHSPACNFTSRLSEHHDEHAHEHHDYSVHIDKNATWLKYRSDPKLIAIDGLEETHITLQDYDHSEPFAHMQNASFFSMENFYFVDPWYHDDQHDPLASDGQQGYDTGEDPLQTKYQYQYSGFMAINCLLAIASVFYLTEPELAEELNLYRAKITRDYVHDELAKKNKILNELKEKEKELLEKTN